MGCQQSKAAVEQPRTSSEKPSSSPAATTEKENENVNKASDSSPRVSNASNKTASSTRPEDAEPTISTHHDDPATPPVATKETAKVLLAPPSPNAAPTTTTTTALPLVALVETKPDPSLMANSPMGGMPKAPLTPRGTRRRKTISAGVKEMAKLAADNESPVGPESPWTTHSVGYLGPPRTEDLFQLGGPMMPMLPTLGETKCTTTTLQPVSERPAATTKTCAGCTKPEVNAGAFKACAKCRDVVYCTKECQRAHWKEHKKDCAPGVGALDSFSSTEEGDTKPEAVPDNATAVKELEEKLDELRASPPPPEKAAASSLERSSVDSSKSSSTPSGLTAASKEETSNTSEAVDENMAPKLATITKNKLQKCSGCTKVESTPGAFKECAKCRSNVVYCTRACQKKHWKEHKKTCCKGPSTSALVAPNKENTVNVART